MFEHYPLTKQKVVVYRPVMFRTDRSKEGLCLAMALLPMVVIGQGLPYLEPGLIVDSEERETADWHLLVEVTLSGDAYPDVTTPALDDGFISGTATLVTVNASCARLPEGNPNATIPMLVSVHLEVGGIEHFKEMPQPSPNSGSVAMRFASTHFGHLTTPSVKGHAIFEHNEKRFSVPVSLAPTVYNKLAGWYHGDPGHAQIGWTQSQREDAARVFGLMAEMIYEGYNSTSSHYSADGNSIQALNLETALDRLRPSTGLIMVTHGSPNSVELCAGLNQPVENMVSGDMNAAWDAGLVTPPSHFAIAYACETVLATNASYFKDAIRVRSIGGAYLGFKYQVPSYVLDESQDPPEAHTLPEHLEDLMEGLALGMCAADAVEYANLGRWFTITLVGDPMATLSTVYLTSAERNAIGGVRPTYNLWYYKL